MLRIKYSASLLMVLVMLGLAACGSKAPTTDPSLAYTQIWLTVEAARTQTSAAESPTPTLTSTPFVSATPLASNTPLISSTPLPGTPSVTAFSISTSPAGTQAATCDNMQGVADITYPDGSEVPSGAIFVKTWSVKNIGPCTWDKKYRLVFGWGGDGTNWNKTPSSYLTSTVLPGETIEISVSLKAPTTLGKYQAAFRLQNSNGYNFGPTQTVVVVVK
jgi:hypothetical protein